MKIIIHKGSQEIGGNCVSITESGKTIWLDFGLPLKEGSAIVEVGKLQPKPDAVLLSHVHLDHSGRINELNELDNRIPIYMGRLTHDLIKALCDFNKNYKRPKNPVEYFQGFITFPIGPFQITAWPVDHSAPDAYSFMVEAGGKTIFYSGDLRAHGRKPKTFENLLKNPPAKVDLMFLEGTMFGRSGEKVKTEEELELEMAEIFKNQTNISFVVSSGQNIDRIVTFICACNRARKIPVVGIYGAWVLEQFYRNYPETEVPNLHKFEDLEVFFEPSQKKKLESAKEFFGDFYGLAYEHHAFKKKDYRHYAMLIGASDFYAELVKKCASHEKVNVIFSMWPEYLTKPEHLKKPGFRAISRLKNHPRVQFHKKHTSGHASIPDLEKLVDALKPQKLCPIHTEHALDFTGLFDNVIYVEDGQELEI